MLTHSRVRLDDTTSHAAEETSRGGVHAHRNGRRLDLGRGEEHVQSPYFLEGRDAVEDEKSVFVLAMCVSTDVVLRVNR